ncbi:hypothetical protein [Clostridium sp. C8-1-8]|uniref:hypothetical protein n=1 Tax=Clostridium sp. C8-1-8 TaxID=2698831 RepID=UPI0019229647|nr:hypothetical protein [Clostridium sp. C8-1-8]
MSRLIRYANLKKMNQQALFHLGNIDTETEYWVQENIDKLRKGVCQRNKSVLLLLLIGKVI